MPDIELTNGQPVPEDRSHTEIDPKTGLQRGYICLTAAERAKGFVKPVRRSYKHSVCGCVTTMATSLAETYARDPYFYSGTFCCGCHKHFPLNEFVWEPDGEPMDPSLQEEWAKQAPDRERAKRREWRRLLMEQIRNREREIDSIKAQVAQLDAEGT